MKVPVLGVYRFWQQRKNSKIGNVICVIKNKTKQNTIGSNKVYPNPGIKAVKSTNSKSLQNYHCHGSNVKM